MFGKLFGMEEVKAELQEVSEEIQVLEHKLELKEKVIKQLKDAVRILEENIKSLLDENDLLKARPDHFGRTSRASGEHMRLLKMYQYNQLSYQEIADKMTEYTGEKWSKSFTLYSQSVKSGQAHTHLQEEHYETAKQANQYTCN